MKAHSIHMPCIFAPPTFSYIFNDRASAASGHIIANAASFLRPARQQQASLGLRHAEVASE